jgi:GR25 family glycosyltransferase involved in LPS biosynthesis
MFADNARKHKFDFKFFDAIGFETLIKMNILGSSWPFDSLEGRGLAGRVGCRYSHIFAMQLNHFIMEDDNLLRPDWENRWHEQEALTPSNWDVLYLNCGLERGRRVDLNDFWYQLIETYYGNWVYVLTLKGRDIKLKYVQQCVITHFDTTIRGMGYLQEATVIRPMRPCFIHYDAADSDTMCK